MRGLSVLGFASLLLVAATGIGPCSEGRESTFSRAGDVVPVALSTRRIAGPEKRTELTIAVYSNGRVHVSRNEGESDIARSLQVDREDVLALHDRLAEAGASELKGDVSGEPVATGRVRYTLVTFFDLPTSPGEAWSTTFGFDDNPSDERATAVWEELEEFVAVHFGPRMLRE